MMLAETEVWVSLNSKIWRKRNSSHPTHGELCGCAAPPFQDIMGRILGSWGSPCWGNPWSCVVTEPSWWGQPGLTWIGKEKKLGSLQHRGNQRVRTCQQWGFSAFGGGGLLSSCWDEKEGADLWLAVERHKAALAGRSRTGEVVPQHWITAGRGKGDGQHVGETAKGEG